MRIDNRPDEHTELFRPASGCLQRRPSARCVCWSAISTARCRTTSACSACAPAVVPDGRVILAPRDGDRPLVELESRPGIRPAARARHSASITSRSCCRIAPRSARFVAHLAVDRHPGGHVRSPGERGDLPDAIPTGSASRSTPTGRASAWSYRDRQLAMATEPLDARGLVAAGDGKPWTGMPAGTVMGHVHLHVGDLDGRRGVLSRRLSASTKWCGTTRARSSCRPAAITITSAPTPGPRTCRPPTDQARLLSWDLVVPAVDGRRRRGPEPREGSGYPVERDGDGRMARDPWGTTVRLVTPRNSTRRTQIDSDERSHDHGQDRPPLPPRARIRSTSPTRRRPSRCAIC